jgi:hypothetical protein
VSDADEMRTTTYDEEMALTQLTTPTIDRFIASLSGDVREGFEETLRLRREFEVNVARLLVARGPAEVEHFGRLVEESARGVARRYAVLKEAYQRWVERGAGPWQARMTAVNE